MFTVTRLKGNNPLPPILQPHERHQFPNHTVNGCAVVNRILGRVQESVVLGPNAPETFNTFFVFKALRYVAVGPKTNG